MIGNLPHNSSSGVLSPAYQRSSVHEKGTRIGYFTDVFDSKVDFKGDELPHNFDIGTPSDG